MTNCVYHANIPAETLCDRCGKPICEKDKRKFYVRTHTGRSHGADGYGRLFYYCPLCNKKASKIEMNQVIVLLVLTPVIILVLKLFNVQLVHIIASVGICLIAIFALGLRTWLDKAWEKEDVEKFLKGLSWQTRGDEDVSVNKLLKISVEGMYKRGKYIYEEIKCHPEEEQRIFFYFRKKSWNYHDLGHILLLFKKDIAYWSWRNDLSEKNKNRTALVFAYLMAVNHLGQVQADEILKYAPPEMIAPGVMQKLIQ